MGVYGLLVAVITLMNAIIHGVDAPPPAWMDKVLIGTALFSIVWAAAASWRRRYRPVRDRPILGWHLIPDFLLLPARMTLSIARHLGARIRVTDAELHEAWQFLVEVHRSGRLPRSSIPSLSAAPRSLWKCVEILQVLGWIDLHQGSEGFFYRLRTTREREFLEVLRLDDPDAGGSGTKLPGWAGDHGE